MSIRAAGPLGRAFAILSFLSFVLLGCRSQRPSDHQATAKVRPLTLRQFARTPQRFARGSYLVNGPGACFYCHAGTDIKKAGWPPLPGTEGSGSDYAFFGQPGIVAANITPDLDTGAGKWTDDMFARAIREGVAHDGRFLDPSVMPYEFYRAMSDEDLASVIIYLRSIPSVRSALPSPKARGNLVTPYAVPITSPIPEPDLSTPEKRGAYLVRIAGCQWCHTLRDVDRRSLPGLEFAGGDLITNPYSDASSANITPDPSGISYYDEAQFLRTMRTGKVGARQISPNMPWWYFGHMTDEDLKAIFAFLRTVKPVHHRVDNTESVSYCRRCGRKHAGGALN
jgi:mono/diheme cytochrome c family protein